MKVQQEQDRVPAKPILLVMLAVVVITAAGVLIAYVMDVRSGDTSVTQGRTRAEHTSVVDRVQSEPALFRGPFLAAERQRPKHVRLQGFGWIDPGAGVVHIPIDRAMRLYVAEERRALAPSRSAAGPGAGSAGTMSVEGSAP